MNIKYTLLALCALGLPAFAQMTPAQTNLDPAAARMEARNARADHQLTAVSPQQALANELKRCAALPPFYKSDCEARVRGQAGTVSGSVVGGGMIRETVTPMPEAQLKALESNPQEMDFPKPLRQRR
ncbi:hypothetical protein [Ottowia sp.]|uniref:hypothetical protein n=1 Tax=Ottowia sp. TaxID=1898956 RepID=UPI0025DEDA55|nr:hypothetical protein [Ottowia sp.]